MILVLSQLLTPALAETTNDFGSWQVININLQLNDKWSLGKLVESRIQDNHSELDQLLIGPSIGYKINDNWSTSLAYVWLSDYSPDIRNEHRIMEELKYKFKLKEDSKLNFSLRTRLEQRFIEHAGHALRARFRLESSYPLNQSKTWSLVLWDEYFFHFYDLNNGPQAGYNQNRAFIGFNHILNKHINFDIGYQLIHNNRASGDDLFNHTIALFSTINL